MSENSSCFCQDFWFCRKPNFDQVQGIKQSNLLENERFFWIRIIQAYAGSIQDSWKKVVDKAPIAIIKEFAVSIQKFLNLSFKYYVEVRGSESGYIYKDSGRIWSPLYIAAEIGHYELCKYIATKTADENRPNDDRKFTDLHIAVYYGKLETFRLIFENVANKNPRDHSGETPLHRALENGYLDICSLIISNVDDKNPKYPIQSWCCDWSKWKSIS